MTYRSPELFGFFAPRPQQALVLYTVLNGQYRAVSTVLDDSTGYRAAKYRVGESNTLTTRNPREP
jgi:hypothetical protein